MTKVLGVATLAAGLAFAAPVLAQNPGPGDGRGAMGERMCLERFAQISGHLAYLEARLDLAAEQRPLWDKLHQALLEGATRQRAACQQRFAARDGERTIVDRLGQLHDMLASRVAALDAVRPALAALYQAASAEQKTLLDHRLFPGPRFAERRGEMRRGDGERPGMRMGPWRRGPGDGPRMGPGRRADNPPDGEQRDD